MRHNASKRDRHEDHFCPEPPGQPVRTSELEPQHERSSDDENAKASTSNATEEPLKTPHFFEHGTFGCNQLRANKPQGNPTPEPSRETHQVKPKEKLEEDVHDVCPEDRSSLSIML